jgi:hypothetical protein
MDDTVNTRIMKLCDVAIKESNSDKRLKLIREISELAEKAAAERLARAKSAGR